MKRRITKWSYVAAGLLWVTMESVQAVQYEPQNQALITVLGTKAGVQKKSFAGTDGQAEMYYAKAGGKTSAVAFIEHGLYKPDCTHTWVVGIDPSSGSVTQVRMIEFRCPHAKPTASASFLDQYKGKGPADVGALDGSVTTVAKATGTSQLCTAAVKRAIQDYAKVKGQI